MKVTLPFIKKLEVGEKHYIYDVNTNAFLRVDKRIFDRLTDADSPEQDAAAMAPHSDAEIADAQKNIDLMKEKGYLSGRRPKITFYHSTEKSEFRKSLMEFLTKRLNRITLGVTDSCNMRCRYCAYSGKYPYHRQHGNNSMTHDTMRKAVDFYLKNSTEITQKSISFYGGEPLLNYDLIYDCVQYVTREKGIQAEYNMTINGTLLSAKRIDFLAENNFSLLISIDGPSEIHGRNRVFKNGKNSFNSIYNNLKLFKARYPEYYSRKIRFKLILTPPLDFNALNRFISDPAIRPASFSFSTVNAHYTSFFRQFNDSEMQRYHDKMGEKRNGYKWKLMTGEPIDDIENAMFRKRFLNIHKRSAEKLPHLYPSHGQCTLGSRSLFVNVDGSFNFCTRIDDVYNLGNVNDGYDFNFIFKIYEDMDNFLSSRCYGCWAIQFCFKCIKDINKNGVLDGETFNRYCQNQKRIILSEMKDYIEIREHNSNALDFLVDVELI